MFSYSWPARAVGCLYGVRNATQHPTPPHPASSRVLWMRTAAYPAVKTNQKAVSDISTHMLWPDSYNQDFALRTPFFWVFTQRVMVNLRRSFGITFRSHLQGLRIQKRRWGITTTRCVMTLKNAVPIYFVAEAWLSYIRFRIVKCTCLPFPLCPNQSLLLLCLTLQCIAISSCSTEWLTFLARISENLCINMQNSTNLYERILIVFLSACNFRIVFPLTRINRMEEMEGNRM